MIISINLTDLEYLTLEQISEKMDLDYNSVLARGLNILQLLQSGAAKLVVDAPAGSQDINIDLMYDRWIDLEAEKTQI